ncbi:hypothetical protein C7N83_03275 [Neisseria iguanae]|uniref:Uncharacterized protein n=1 Tax=Neisseria iguanae TaxID=90242 RepID=A0A2P7U1R7_9NEIS|nr:hypothetical protein C7N83_03275 [Neisseria iguanae]
MLLRFFAMNVKAFTFQTALVDQWVETFVKSPSLAYFFALRFLNACLAMDISSHYVMLTLRTALESEVLQRFLAV